MLKQYESWTCTRPTHLSGQSILHLPNTSFVCQQNLTDCPDQCTCLVRAVDDVIIVNCTDRNLTSLPHRLPEGERIQLHAQQNNIQQVTSAPNYLRYLQYLNLESNQLFEIHIEFFRVCQVQFLYLSNNLLSNTAKLVRLNFSTSAFLFSLRLKFT